MNKLNFSALILLFFFYSEIVFSHDDVPKILANDKYISSECAFLNQYADEYLTYVELWCDDDKPVAYILYVFANDYGFESDVTLVDLLSPDEGYRAIVNNEHEWIVWKE